MSNQYLVEELGAFVSWICSTGALEDATDDSLVEAFSIAGTPDECRRKLDEYQAVVPHVILHTPYGPPLRGEESRESLRWITEAFSR